MASKSNGTFGITGMPRPEDVKMLTKTIPYTPGMPLRSEISVVYASLINGTLPPATQDLVRMQWTLFILGLERHKSLPVDEKLSYFQVAGIHGYPETSWDSVVAPNPDPEQGYCHHNDILFPTWHRPYMLLYEQCIWIQAQAVIADWVESGKLNSSQADAWYNAAKTWRLYYWDWGFNARLPAVTGPAVVTVWLPDSQGAPNTRKDDQANPLTGFVNPEKDASGNPLPFGNMPDDKKQYNIKAHQSYPWDKCSGVSRYGLTDALTPVQLQGINNYDTACAQMENISKLWYTPRGPQRDQKDPPKPTYGLGEALNRMFSPNYNKTWGSFASTKWNSEYELDVNLGYMSLEYIHNNVHNICGGSAFDPGVGHMSDVPVAAFDPIFWLHHCNIDRLVAMWQILNWSLWWDSAEPEKQVNKPDFKPTDPLLPFHTKDNADPNGDFWTSDQARNWTLYNYQYSDLLPGADAIGADGTLIEEKYIDDMRSYINNLYPGSSFTAFAVFANRDVENDSFFGHLADTAKWEDAAWKDYLINIRYDRYALEGASYSIEFYLGGEGDDNREAALADRENFVGSVYSFGGMTLRTEEEGGCANCSDQRDSKVLSRGQLPLTIPLINQARSTDERFASIHNIKVDEVEDYLAKHLYWKFTKFGVEVPASEFPYTKIAVWVGEGRPTLVDSKWQPPTYSDYKPLWEATEGKECGLTKDDENLGEGKWQSGNA